jgi:hypothetical protein
MMLKEKLRFIGRIFATRVLYNRSLRSHFCILRVFRQLSHLEDFSGTRREIIL